MPNQKLLPLGNAVHIVTGQSYHRVTLGRWATEGIRGVRLRSWKVGGRRLTTIEAVREFIELTGDEDATELPVTEEVAAR